MSIISKRPELWSNNEVLYKINIYEKNWELRIELDKNWNIKTNINSLVSRVISYKEEWKVVEVDHDLYCRINDWINPLNWVIKDNILQILKWIYYFNKKSV